MKAKLSLLSLAVCAAFGASSAFAQITFEGNIISATCTATFSGSGSGGGNVGAQATVNVGTIDATQLSSPNQPAGGSDFTITLHQDCPQQRYFAVFSADAGNSTGQVNTGGRLVTNLSNVSLQLHDGSTSGNAIKFNSGIPNSTQLAAWGSADHTSLVADFGVDVASGTAKTYGVRWFREGSGTPGTGTLTGVTARYHIVYH